MPRPKDCASDCSDYDPRSSWLRAELRELRRGQENIEAALTKLSNSIGKGNREVDIAPLTGTRVSTGRISINNSKPIDRMQRRAVTQDLMRSTFRPRAGHTSFVDGQRDAKERARDLLRRTFEVDEELKHEERELHHEKRQRLDTYGGCFGNFFHWLRLIFNRSDFDSNFDLAIGLLIIANAAFIGIQMDYQRPGQKFWFAIDSCFSICFILELGMKLYRHGLRGHFGHFFNCFDCVLVVLDLAQLILEVMFPNVATAMANAPSASLFRVIRLLRLGRLVRALKSEAFKSLSEMVHGILAGMATLGWSFLLLVLFLYIVALVMRESLGKTLGDPTESQLRIADMFNSVPRAMLTMFRCSFGDCTFGTGEPIFEKVLPAHGPAYVVFYTACLVIVSIIIFNVIAAMFVESTKEAAERIEREKKRQRLLNEKLLCSRIATIIARMIEISPEIQGEQFGELNGKLSDRIDDIMNIEVPVSVVDYAIHDNIIHNALLELDISHQDHNRLSDIFDPDGGGTIPMADLAAGIKRVRGDPRRSDIICIDVMMRSTLPVLAEILEGVNQMKQGLIELSG
eukprot:TRINITY_DN87829_c0_g1_i1.p1 TRINITY_DN87829_c0_g1~~TRINITY_DN87829_c0_g1_i1.p1  ORF type:complete len:580 (+),score=80.15 TRINITY_DN87829_c0_g1_i1:29-1741(+)